MSGDGIHGGQGVCCPTFATAHSEQEQGKKEKGSSLASSVCLLPASGPVQPRGSMG